MLPVSEKGVEWTPRPGVPRPRGGGQAHAADRRARARDDPLGRRQGAGRGPGRESHLPARRGRLLDRGLDGRERERAAERKALFARGFASDTRGGDDRPRARVPARPRGHPRRHAARGRTDPGQQRAGQGEGRALHHRHANPAGRGHRPRRAARRHRGHRHAHRRGARARRHRVLGAPAPGLGLQDRDDGRRPGGEEGQAHRRVPGGVPRADRRRDPRERQRRAVRRAPSPRASPTRATRCSPRSA